MSASKLAVLLCAVMACPHAAIAQVVWAPPAAGSAGDYLATDAAVVRATLQNPMPNTFLFGSSVAIDGDTLAVGAPGFAQAGTQLGGVAIYTRAGGTWVLQQSVTRASASPSSGLRLGRLGQSVALSGDTLVVNGYYVFVRNGGTWTQQAELIPNGRVSSLTSGDAAIAADVDGDTALVAYNAGAVLAFARTGTVWTEQARLRSAEPSSSSSRLGDIDLDGNTVLIGEPFETVGANSSQGAAHVFVRNRNVWTRQAVLTARTGRANSNFGRVLALSGDTAIVGPRHGHVFSRGSGIWVEHASLELPADPYSPSLTLGLDNVTLDGDTAIVSSSTGFSSATNAYRRSGGRWTRLEPAFTTWPTMAISGNTMVVGEPGFGGNDSDPIYPRPGPGIAYVLELPDGGTPQAPALTGRVSGTTVTLNWAPSAGGAATSYVIEAGTAAGASNVFNGNVGNVLQVSATPSPATYFVRVRGVNDFGAGAASNEVVLTVGPTSPLVPGAPTLTGSASSTTVTLSWTPSAGGGGPTSYVLEAGTAAGMSNVFSGNVGGGTELAATVTAGTYYVRLRGVNASGIGVASNEIVLTVSGCTLPATPTGLTFTRSGDVVTVLWNAAPGAVQYFLEAGTSPGARNVYNGNVGATTSVSARVNPATYYVRVLSANGCAVSSASSEVSIVVP